MSNLLLSQIQSNMDSINEGFLINRELNVLNKIPKTVKLSDISHTRVLLMKVYVIAIKTKIKYIDKTLEFGNPLEVSESKEELMHRYNQDGFGFKVATAVTKHSNILINHVKSKLPKKIVDQYMDKIEIGDFKLDPDKGIITTFIGNADDFEDGPNFEVKFKLVGSTIKVTETMKF